jgi:hypothetical protein
MLIGFSFVDFLDEYQRVSRSDVPDTKAPPRRERSGAGRSGAGTT